MKTLIVLLLTVCGITTVQAQTLTQLEETKVEFTPYTIIPTSDLDSYEVVVTESYVGQFSKNALKFIKENFNAKQLIQAIYVPGHDSYLISFKSSKGYLDATYSKDGKLEKTYQKFQNIALPYDIRNQIYISHKGWTMTKNTYVASGKMNMINKEFYRIKLENGNKSQNIKIYPGSSAQSVATN